MNYSELPNRHKKDLYLRTTLNRILLEYLYDNCVGFNDDIAAILCRKAGKYTEEKGIEYISEILGYLDVTLEPKRLNENKRK